jgi:HK97 family phage portal protein
MKTKPKKLRVKVRRQTRSNLRTPDAWLRDILVGDNTTSGFAVNEANCLNAVVVYACVRNLSEDIAKLPLFLYRRLKPRGKERADDLPLYRLLHDSPNDEMTSFDFRQAMMVDVLLGGNAYAHVMRANGGQPLALMKLARNRVTPTRDGAGNIVYVVKNDGSIPDAVIPAEDMIHIRNMGDGLVGWSIIKLARESIGLSLSAENSGSSFLRQQFASGWRAGDARQDESRGDCKPA